MDKKKKKKKKKNGRDSQHDKNNRDSFKAYGSKDKSPSVKPLIKPAKQTRKKQIATSIHIATESGSSRPSSKYSLPKHSSVSLPSANSYVQFTHPTPDITLCVLVV
jgi:hypothetical protein